MFSSAEGSQLWCYIIYWTQQDKVIMLILMVCIFMCGRYQWVGGCVWMGVFGGCVWVGVIDII